MKRKILTAVLDSLFLIIFNLSVFVFFAMQKNASFWLAFGFVHAAYILFLCTQFLGENTKTGYLLSLSNYALTTFNFLEILAAAVILLNIDLGWRKETFIYLIITVINAAFLCINMLSNNATAKNENARNQSADLKKQILQEINRIVHATSAENLRQAQAFQENVKYLPLRKENGEENFTAQKLEALRRIQTYSADMNCLF